MTRIALVLSYFPTDLSPQSGMQFYHMSRALAKMAHLGIFVVTQTYPKNRLLRPRRFVHHEGDQPIPLGNVPIQHIRYPALPIVSRVMNGLTCGRMLLHRLRDFKPDVVLSYQVYPEGYAALYAAERLGVPCVSGAIGSDLRCSAALVRPLVRSTLRRSSFVITVCEELSQRAAQMGVPESKIATVLNGCDSTIFYRRDRDRERISLGVPSESRLVVFTGNLVRVKGLPDLLRAVAMLSNSGMPVDATLIGTGPMGDELRSLSRNLGIEQRIRFTGGLAPSDVARWLGAADLFCLPSMSEGSPNVIMEALRSGRPVVASNVGGIPELIDDSCGLLTAPSNPAALAEGLREAFQRKWDEATIARMHDRTWEDMASDTYEICVGCIRGGALAPRQKAVAV